MTGTVSDAGSATESASAAAGSANGPVGDASGSRTPLLRVVRGNPTDEELAALTVVLAAKAAAATPAPEPPRSRWRDRASLLRTPLHPGPGAWRAALRRW